MAVVVIVDKNGNIMASAKIAVSEPVDVDAIKSVIGQCFIEAMDKAAKEFWKKMIFGEREPVGAMPTKTCLECGKTTYAGMFGHTQHMCDACWNDRLI